MDPQPCVVLLWKGNAASTVETEENDKILISYNTREFSKRLEKHESMFYPLAIRSSSKVAEIHVPEGALS